MLHVTAALMSFAAPVLVAAQAIQRPVSPLQGEFQLRYQPSIDVGTRIPLGTRVVTLVEDEGRPLQVWPPADQYVASLTRSSAAVGVFTVTRQTGGFNAKRDWIMSTVYADVVDVLKASRGGELTAGQKKVVFRAHGGVAIIGDSTVTAMSTSYTGLLTGSTYLVFLVLDEQSSLFTWGGGQYLVSAERLLSTDTDPHSPPHGELASPIFADIRRASGLPPP